jgi:hypothetical protein
LDSLLDFVSIATDSDSVRGAPRFDPQNLLRHALRIDRAVWGRVWAE